MKKWSNQVLFLSTILITNSLGGISQVSKGTESVIENAQYRVTIAEVSTDASAKQQGRSIGKNFVQFRGYTATEIIQQIGNKRVIFSNKSKTSRIRYNCKIESKLTDPVQVDGALLDLLSKPLRCRYKSLQRQIKSCRLVIGSPEQLKASQIVADKNEKGVKTKTENGKFYCYDCTLNDLQKAVQTSCEFENSPNTTRFSIVFDLNQPETELKQKGIILMQYQKTTKIFEVTLL